MMMNTVHLGRSRRLIWALTVMALGVTAVAPAATVASPATRRVNVRSNGAQATGGHTRKPAISATGRYLVFASEATNLVANDSNSLQDIFIHDRKTRKTVRVNVRSNGAQSLGGGSYGPVVSAGGRFVAFSSDATNLIATDTNATRDVFVHDRKSGKTKRVSVRSGGAEGDKLSDGPSISADGRFVAFVSVATNLVKGDTNDKVDVFVRDRNKKTTKRVSVRSNGNQGIDSSSSADISGNGRFVAFFSGASNLVAHDNNGGDDVFVHDRKTKKTRRVSLRSDGTEVSAEQGSPAISANGRFISFFSRAGDLVSGDTNGWADVFVHDRKTKKTKRVSVRSNGDQGVGAHSAGSDISASGRFVVFDSFATGLVKFDTNGKGDVFVHDRKTKKTRRVSVRSNGAQALGNSRNPGISADGRYVVFESSATNLVNNDTNLDQDAFRRGPLAGR